MYRKIEVLALLMAAFAVSAAAQTAHFSGVLSTLPSGTLNYAYGVAVDSSGNIYIANSGFGQVLKETPSGGSYTESTIGSGLYFPAAIAVDGSGNVYIADTDNHRVLKETLSGSTYSQSTIANGLGTPYGIAVDNSGNVYIADTGNNGVLKETVSGNSYTQSTIISGSSFTGIAVDSSGNIYLSERSSNQVVKETLSGDSYIQSTIATGIENPSGIAIDSIGNVYIADLDTASIGRVLEETPSSGGYIQNVVYSGTIGPLGVAIDARQILYVTNIYTTQLMKVQLSGATFGSINVGSPSAAIPLTYIFDTGGTLGSTAAMTQGAPGLDFTDAGTGTCATGAVYTAGESCTVDVSFTPKFAGTRYGAAELLDGSGNVLATGYVQGTGVGPQVNFLPGTQSVIANGSTKGLSDTQGVAVDGSGNVYIADELNNRVLKETLSAGSYTQSVVADYATNGLHDPFGVAVDGSGNVYIADSSVYIADSNNYRVLKETPSGGNYIQTIVANYANNGLVDPMGVAVDGSGNVYIADTGNMRVLKETPSAGSYTQSVVANYTNGLDETTGIAVDGSGNVYIADPNNSWVLKETLSAGGYTQSVVANSATNGLHYPIGVAVDGSGNVYIADRDLTNNVNSRLLRETLSAGSYSQSVVLTFASNINPSYPSAVAVDGSDNVYFSDYGNYRVLKEDFANPPSLTFASTAYDAISADSPQTVTLENVGNAPLSFPIPATGDNPSITTNFTLNSSGASACQVEDPGTATEETLLPGASCELPISFAPEAVGTLSGSLVITDNNLNAAAPWYTSQSIALSGKAIQATPTITWATPTAITYGAGLGSGQLNATSSIAGSFAYSPVSGTVLGVGTQTLNATFTPTDTTDYKTATATATLTVNQATPAITWATPAAITSGTALSATQLDATASVPGTFVYNPALGAMPPVGNDSLSVTFTPTDNVDYATATSTVILTVNTPPNPVPVMGSMTPAIADAGGAAFTLTVNGAGFLANSTINWGTTPLATQFVSATQLTAQVTAADIATAGAYAITVQTPAPGGGSSGILQFEVDTAGSTATGPTFTSTAVTVTAGSSASYAVILPSTVTASTISCLNIPPGASCSYSATTNTVTITTSATTPAGTYQVTVVFNETVSGAATSWILLPILLLPLVFKRRRMAARGVWVTACLGLVLLVGAALCNGCGGGGGNSGGGGGGGGTQTHQVTSSGVVTLTVQ